MSAQNKKFGKGTRDVPAASEKAQKWYPADDESQPKKVSRDMEPFTCVRRNGNEDCQGD